MRRNNDPEYRRRAREKAEDDKRKTDSERRDGDTQDQIERIVDAIGTITKQRQRDKKDEDRQRFYDRLFQAGEIAALVAAAIVGLIAIYVGNSDSAKQLMHAYPPKLLINNVAIWPKGAYGEFVDLPKIKEIEGQAWAVNVGSEVTNLTQIICVVYWRDGPLPMLRPYDSLSRNDCAPLKRPGEKETVKTMDPGAIASWKFDTVVPADFTPTMHLYVMGYIIHHDNLDVRHATVFARWYDPSARRFITVKDNPDYEGIE